MGKKKIIQTIEAECQKAHDHQNDLRCEYSLCKDADLGRALEKATDEMVVLDDIYEKITGKPFRKGVKK